jgi:holliday junction DNA helicase RuvA
MIAYLEGKLLAKEEDRILLLVNHIGYEILLPAIVMESLKTYTAGDPLSLHIYYHQTERQPKPVLIGFNSEIEKEFFQYFISVEAIGPLKAVKALNIPVSAIAAAIESGDVETLKNMKSIGTRTAQKIIATLAGKMSRFALIQGVKSKEKLPAKNFGDQVLEVLVSQLGHKASDAKLMISEALKRNPGISSPEALFDEIYRAYKP